MITRLSRNLSVGGRLIEGARTALSASSFSRTRSRGQGCLRSGAAALFRAGGAVRRVVRTALTLMLPGCFLLVSSSIASDSLSLAGRWRFALDRADVGIKEQWFANPTRLTHELQSH
jgi:hypothetical protein